ELLHVVRVGEDDDLVRADLLDHGLQRVQRVVLDQASPRLVAGGAQGPQGHLQGPLAHAPGLLALGGLPLADGLVELAEGDVVDGPQEPVRLFAAWLEQDVEGDRLVAVQGGDELHVGGRQGLLDHQYACEHQRPFSCEDPRALSPPRGGPAPAETILPRDRTGTTGFSVPAGGLSGTENSARGPDQRYSRTPFRSYRARRGTPGAGRRPEDPAPRGR